MNLRIKELLEFAGWYKGRTIDIGYEILILQKEGFTLPGENLRKLFIEYWNLKIEFILPDNQFSDLELNIETAIQGVDQSLVSRYETIAGKKLVPAGSLHFRTGVILVSVDCYFYFINNGFIYQIATTFEDFLDVVINRKEVYKITTHN